MPKYLSKYILLNSLPLAAAGVLTSSLATAQTTVFDDDFTGAFDTIDPAWNAPSYVRQNGGGQLVARKGGTGQANSTSYLDYTLSSGNLYELSVDIVGDTTNSDTSQYGGFGFFSEVTSLFSPYHQQDGGSPTGAWMFIRTQNTDANEGDMSLRPLGGGSTGASTIDSSFDVTVSRNYKLVLNTSDTDAAAGTQFSLGLYVDDVQYGSTYIFSDVESAALLTNVVGVGLTAQVADGGPNIIYDNFKLTTTVIPEPGTFALLSGLTMLTAVAIRRRRS